MAFLLSPKFRALADQEVYSDFDELEYKEIVAKLIVIQQAIFDKPVKHQHLKALYVKGFVDGKPMNKMLVDGGASVNLMPTEQKQKAKTVIRKDVTLKQNRKGTGVFIHQFILNTN